jgi:hypothetical protein
VTPAGRGAQTAPRQSATRTLQQVREILEETCDADGQPPNLQELARRKAYRAGINRALEVIQAATDTRR